MTTTIFIQRSLRKVKKEVNNTLLWYDTKNKRMLRFRGGKLNFNYDPQDKNTTVTVEPLYQNKTEWGDNTDDINQWIINHEQDFSLDVVSANDKSFTISYDDDNKKEVEESLNRAGLNYATGSHNR